MDKVQMMQNLRRILEARKGTSMEKKQDKFWIANIKAGKKLACTPEKIMELAGLSEYEARLLVDMGGDHVLVRVGERMEVYRDAHFAPGREATGMSAWKVGLVRKMHQLEEIREPSFTMDVPAPKPWELPGGAIEDMLKDYTLEFSV